jgi:hypothetical protein
MYEALSAGLCGHAAGRQRVKRSMSSQMQQRPKSAPTHRAHKRLCRAHTLHVCNELIVVSEMDVLQAMHAGLKTRRQCRPKRTRAVPQDVPRDRLAAVTKQYPAVATRTPTTTAVIVAPTETKKGAVCTPTESNRGAKSAPTESKRETSGVAMDAEVGTVAVVVGSQHSETRMYLLHPRKAR